MSQECFCRVKIKIEEKADVLKESISFKHLDEIHVIALIYKKNNTFAPIPIINDPYAILTIKI